MIRVFHVSDLHFGCEDADAINAFARVVHAERPDAVIVTGDLTMRARRAEFDAAAQWLASLDVALQIDVGNHDLPYYNPWKRFVRPYARSRRLEDALEVPIVLPGIAIVPLRTTARAQLRFNWADGVVRRRQLDTTLAKLAQLPDGVVKIVTCHHPLAGEKTRGGTRAIGELAAAGADLILSGHDHDPFDRPWRDGRSQVRLVGAGTLSERVRATPPSFNMISIEGGAVDVAVRTLSPAVTTM